MLANFPCFVLVPFETCLNCAVDLLCSGLQDFLRETSAAGGESTKAEGFRAFWEAGAPLVGDDGAKGWATWESRQGVTAQAPAANGTSTPGHHLSQSPGLNGVTPGKEGITIRPEEEEKGGWGEWVPLIPDTPQDPKSAVGPLADEATPASDEVSCGLNRELSYAPCCSAPIWWQSCIKRSWYPTRSLIAWCRAAFELCCIVRDHGIVPQ